MPFEITQLYCCKQFYNNNQICIGQSFDQSSETWRSLARVAALCNRAIFKPDQEGIPIPKVKDDLWCYCLICT